MASTSGSWCWGGMARPFTTASAHRALCLTRDGTAAWPTPGERRRAAAEDAWLVLWRDSGVPVRVRDVGEVSLGPDLRRGSLGGALQAGEHVCEAIVAVVGGARDHQRVVGRPRGHEHRDAAGDDQADGQHLRPALP